MPIFEDDDDFADSWRGKRDDSFDEDPDPQDVSGDDGEVKCVHCGRYIHHEAEICPHCRMWQSEEGGPAHKPRWFVITVILCVAAISGALGIGVAFMLGWRL